MRAANECKTYVDIMTGKKLSLLTWASISGQFIHSVGGEGIK